MNDLHVAVFCLAIVSGVAFLAGRHLSLTRPARLVRFISVGVSLLMLAYLLLLWNRPILLQLLPTSGVIVLGNWLPVYGSFFAGVYSASLMIPRIRRLVLGTAALGLSVYSAIAPLTGVSPVCSNALNHRTGLHLQTTPYTCSAACAASVLRLHGIDTTEGEMADLCLTRQGTHWMGLYRGLKVKTLGTNWDVVVEYLEPGAPIAGGLSPCVLSVNLNVDAFPAELDHGFQDHCGHSVVLLRQQNPGTVSVFDPSPEFGFEEWDNRVLNGIEDGFVFRLIPRDPNDAQTLAVSRQLATAMFDRQLTAGL